MRFSIKGWNVTDWLHGNKTAIKLIISTLGTVSIFGITVEAAVIAIIVNAALNIADYYVSEVDK